MAESPFFEPRSFPSASPQCPVIVFDRRVPALHCTVIPCRLLTDHEAENQLSVSTIARRISASTRQLKALERCVRDSRHGEPGT